MDRRTVLIMMLALVAIAAVIGSQVYTVYASANGENNNGYAEWANGAMRLNGGGLCRWEHRWRWGGGYGSIEVSEEYEENVINIAESDPDVQELLDEGYEIKAVRPIIASKIEADGTVVMKATNATVILQKDTASRATVWVNLEKGKVTKIVIMTVTVIEKS